MEEEHNKYYNKECKNRMIYHAEEALSTCVVPFLKSSHGHLRAKKIFQEMKKFLELKNNCDQKDIEIGPSLIVDEAWHAAILNTEEYYLYCQTAFGRLIHHSTLTTTDSVSTKNERIKRGIEEYKKKYDAEPDMDIWKLHEEVGIEGINASNIVSKDVTVSQGGMKRGNPLPLEGDLRDVKKRKKEDGKEEEKIELLFRSNRNDAEISYKARASIKMEKFMKAYCDRLGLELSFHEFLFDGERISRWDTPSSLGMKNGDVVHVIYYQRGC